MTPGMAMSAWFLAILLKMALLPVIAFAYWLVAIKGGFLLAKLIPSEKWRRILTEPRYDFNWKNPRREPYPQRPQRPAKLPESLDGH